MPLAVSCLVSNRDLDRERAKLENQEHKVIADVKKAAKNGQMVRALSLSL